MVTVLTGGQGSSPTSLTSAIWNVGTTTGKDRQLQCLEIETRHLMSIFYFNNLLINLGKSLQLII